MPQLEMTTQPPLLEVHDLVVSYGVNGRALDGASLQVFSGEVYGLVGESGSGKTTLALAILGLIEPPGSVDSGQVSFDGRLLDGLSEQRLDEVRGGQIGLIFQNARASLNPTFSLGSQVAEVLQVHRGFSRTQAQRQAATWLARVGLAGSENSYPHQLSSGQAQRAMIALALAPKPQLLIADEPTSALDATVQSRIMRLIGELTGPAGTTVLLITHDLGLLAQTAQQVGVLHNGRVVEQQPVDLLFSEPQHEYTRHMIASLPRSPLWPPHEG